MEELTNRSRAFAEAVVTMVWLVLLPVALKGQSTVTGLYVPNFLLFLACSAIITGICPLLACCIFKNQHAISDVACLFSAIILFFLATWIALYTVSDFIVVCVACVSLFFTELRILSYWGEIRENGHPSRAKEFYTILDGSLEFLCCMTGIHFLWLESLALEAMGIVSKSHGTRNALSEAMGIVSILFFSIGLCSMHIEMTPPRTSTKMGDIAGPIFGLDTFMIISIGTVLGASIWKSLVFPAGLQLLIAGPLIAAFVLLLHVSCPEEAAVSQEKELPKLAIDTGVSEEMEQAKVAKEARVRQEIELTKVEKEEGVSQEIVQDKVSKEAGVSQEIKQDKMAKETGVSQEIELDKAEKDAGASQEREVTKVTIETTDSQEIQVAKVAKEAGVSQEKKPPKLPEEPPKLAPLGLTKLMVTGFQTVSISVDSSGVSITNWFLVFAAAAIVSGLTWRLLTQLQVKNMLENNITIGYSQVRNDKIAAVASSAKTACVCAHTFVAVATVLLMFEICSVKNPTTTAAPGPAPTRT